MKKTLSQTNKDLDLRRFGKDVYSKALNGSGGSDGEKEITYDDVVKYYTNGKYQHFEDIPELVVDTSSIDMSSMVVDETVQVEFYFSIDYFASFNANLRILEDANLLKNGDYLRVGDSIYRISDVQGSAQEEDLAFDLLSVGDGGIATMHIVYIEQDKVKTSLSIGIL